MKQYLRGSLVALALLGATPAEAASCIIITYYSDASLTRVVGSWSNCPGQKGLQGRRTKHSERETIQLRSPPPGPGSLPCEFLKQGCRPLPSRR